MSTHCNREWGIEEHEEGPSSVVVLTWVGGCEWSGSGAATAAVTATTTTCSAGYGAAAWACTGRSEHATAAGSADGTRAGADGTDGAAAT